MRAVQPSLPIVLPCHGVSAGGLEADGVAARLAERGLAEIVEDIEEIVAAAAEGRHVIALDGCAAACRARLLDARGVATLRALNLEGASTADAAAIDDLDAVATAVPRRRRTAHVSSAEFGPKRTHSAEDYVLALDILTSPVVECGALSDTPTLAAHVATMLGVSRPAAGEMLARLEHEELIRRGEQKNVLFTPKGRGEADRLLRKQRILECFAVQTLGYGADECHEQARRLSAGFDDAIVERTWAVLGRPERCPHGWPVDPVRARAESRGLFALSTAASGGSVAVERLEETNPARIRALAAAGVAPGSELHGVEVNGAAGMVAFAETSISLLLAGSALVRAL